MQIRLVVLVILLLPWVAEASQLEIDYSVNQTYYLNNEISLNLTITNPTNQTLNLTIQSNFEGNCTTWTYADNFNIRPNETKIRKAYQFKVNEWDYGGRCDIVTSVFDSKKNRLAGRIDSFYTEGIPKKINFEIKFCLDEQCQSQKTIFYKGESIYLRIYTNLPETEFPAMLIYPNNSSLGITLPTSIDADDIGSYEISVNLSKEGYLPHEAIKAFAVIDENDIKRISSGSQNQELKKDNEEIIRTYEVILALAILGLASFLVYRAGHKKKKKP
jgi:hypothetical protein